MGGSKWELPAVLSMRWARRVVTPREEGLGMRPSWEEGLGMRPSWEEGLGMRPLPFMFGFPHLENANGGPGKLTQGKKATIKKLFYFQGQ